MAENERLALVVKELKEKRLIFNNADLASILEVSPTYVSLLINGKKPLTGKMVNNMVTRFPDINPAWLMTGEGEMLRAGSAAEEPASYAAGAGGIAQLRAEVDELKKQFDDERRTLLEQNKKLTDIIERLTKEG